MHFPVRAELSPPNRFVLGVFYSNIVVEGVEHIPSDGTPCILTANHSNSLTDALLLVTTVPRWVSPCRRSTSSLSYTTADLLALPLRDTTETTPASVDGQVGPVSPRDFHLLVD